MDKNILLQSGFYYALPELPPSSDPILLLSRNFPTRSWQQYVFIKSVRFSERDVEFIERLGTACLTGVVWGYNEEKDHWSLLGDIAVSAFSRSDPPHRAVVVSIKQRRGSHLLPLSLVCLFSQPLLPYISAGNIKWWGKNHAAFELWSLSTAYLARLVVWIKWHGEKYAAHWLPLSHVALS